MALIALVLCAHHWACSLLQESASVQQSDLARVERVVDGDTIIANRRGDRLYVRLLNINTPETVHPHKPAQCLGAEASAFLTDLLPAGTTVELRYDHEREDRYGRTLAAVYTSEGRSVSAAIAAAGLSEAVVYGTNRRYLPEVQQAVEQARTAHRGRFAEHLACIPGEPLHPSLSPGSRRTVKP